jgi:hypothetical protein
MQGGSSFRSQFQFWESVTLCLEGEREGRSHNIRELHDMIAFWGGLNLNIIHPNPVVAIICYRLNTKYKDEQSISAMPSPTI